MGTRRSPTLNPTMGLLGSSLTFIFGQRIHPFIPSQPHHSLTCHPSNIQFVHPSGYSNATGLRLLCSHLYTWGGQSSWHAPHMGVHSKLLWWQHQGYGAQGKIHELNIPKPQGKWWMCRSWSDHPFRSKGIFPLLRSPQLKVPWQRGKVPPFL